MYPPLHPKIEKIVFILEIIIYSEGRGEELFVAQQWVGIESAGWEFFIEMTSK